MLKSMQNAINSSFRLSTVCQNFLKINVVLNAMFKCSLKIILFQVNLFIVCDFCSFVFIKNRVFHYLIIIFFRIQNQNSIAY